MTKRRKPSEVTAERERVFLFILCETAEDKNAKPIPVADLYKAYKKWLWNKFEEHKRTTFTVDSFGTLLPKTLERKTAYWKGGTCRAVVGIRFL
jgi:hypothetical protein